MTATTVNFVPVVLPTTLPEDPVLYRCCVCEDIVGSDQIDKHAGRNGHGIPTMRVFRNERAYEVWLDEQEAELTHD